MHVYFVMMFHYHHQILIPAQQVLYVLMVHIMMSTTANVMNATMLD